jgi:hypothetical protein
MKAQSSELNSSYIVQRFSLSTWPLLMPISFVQLSRDHDWRLKGNEKKIFIYLLLPPSIVKTCKLIEMLEQDN